MPLWWNGRHTSLRSWRCNRRVGSTPTGGTPGMTPAIQSSVKQLQYPRVIFCVEPKALKRTCSALGCLGL